MLAAPPSPIPVQQPFIPSVEDLQLLNNRQAYSRPSSITLVSHTPSPPPEISSPSISNHNNRQYDIAEEVEGTGLENITSSMILESSGSESGRSISTAGDSASWEEWVKTYSKGEWVKNTGVAPEVPTILEEIIQNFDTPRPVSPPLLPSSSTHPSTSADQLHLYTNSELSGSDTNSPEALLSFFKQHGYFPAVKGPHEEERLRTIRRYGLGSGRKEAIDRVCRIAKNYYSTATVLITLVLEDSQVLTAEHGWGEDMPAGTTRSISLEPSLCTHSMLNLDRNATFIVEDPSEDWRFKKNPYSTAQGGKLGFYTSANIHLPTTGDAKEGKPSTVPVGSFCVIDNRPRKLDSFTESDKTVLHDLADMVAREFQLGFEQDRREIEKKQTEFLKNFMNSLLISPNDPTLTPQQSSDNSAPATTAIRNQPETCTSFFALHKEAAEHLSSLTGSQAAAIFDLRSFKCPTAKTPTSPSGVPTPPVDDDPMGRTGNAFSRFRSGKGAIILMGTSGSNLVDFEQMSKEPTFGDTVSDTLRAYYETGLTTFNGTQDSPFQAILPATATCLVPIFDVDGTPSLLLVLSSVERHFTFDPAAVRFTQHVGAVIMGAFLRQRAVEADRAKLAFVSQISHELRTPLHGVSSQVELIREVSSEAQLVVLGPLLGVAEICLESLRDVLDDTLDFAKLSNTKPEEIAAAHLRSLSLSNLESLIESVATTTWVRKRRVDHVSSEAKNDLSPVAGVSAFGDEKVDLILNIQEREGGWDGLIDVGGMKRVLLNILGNALKFTSSGSVTLTLTELPSEGGTSSMVAIDVKDTGCGMSADFIRNGKLFTAFIQENSFSMGAGLGMSICDTIVKRMSGRIEVTSALGQGSTFRVIVPIQLHNSTQPLEILSERPSHTRIVSAEPLSSFLKPRTPHPIYTGNSSLPTTPTGNGHDSFAEELKRTQSPAGLHLSPPMKAKLALFASGVDLHGNRNSISGTLISPLSPGPIQATLVNVLCADDNVLARNILSKLLSGKNVKYTVVADGEEAVTAYRNDSFNLLLLDVQMPNKDGIEASFEIREYEKAMGLPRCRIVALTGLSNDADMEKAGVLNGDGPIDAWLTKGGRSLKSIVKEITDLQSRLEAWTR